MIRCSPIFIFGPSPAFVDALQAMYLTLGKRGVDRADHRKGKEWAKDLPPQEDGVPDEIYQTGHANFLCDAITALWLSGREDYLRKAEYYYEYLREHYRDDDGKVMERYLLPLDEFVFSLFSEQLEIRKYTESMINEVTHGAFYELMLGQMDGYKRRMDAAKRFWRIYRQRVPEWSLDRLNPRQKLPSIAEFRRGVLEYMMAREPIDPILKANLWRRCMTDLDLVRAVYDQVIERLRQECKARGMDVAKAFPEPPGMQAYRASQAKGKKKPDVEVGWGSKR